MIKTRISSLLILATLLFSCPAFSQIGFQPYQTYITGSSAKGLVVKDINNDGLDDVALVNGWKYNAITNFTLMIYFQNQGGTLNSPLIYPYTGDYGSYTRAIDAADLNNDSKMDIVIPVNDSIYVFYQENESSFTKVSYYSGPNTDAIKTGDLNNDGLADIAVSHYNASFMKVFYQDNSGNLNPVSYPSSETGMLIFRIVDINNDGLNDLLGFSTVFYAGLYIYLQNSNHQLDLPFTYNTGINIFPKGFTVGLLNNDSRPDIVITGGGNSPGATIAILYQKEDSFGFHDPVLIPAYDIPKPVCIGDLNCDGINEIIVAHAGWHSVTYYEQDENGDFGDYTRINNVYGNYESYNMDTGDLNHDGMLDIAIASDDLVIHCNDTKPPVSDTLYHPEVILNDTTLITIPIVLSYLDTVSPYVFWVTENLEVNRLYHNINQWENYYAFREGVICGNYIIDSTLIGTEYKEYQYLLSMDTVFVSRTVDTLNLGIASFSWDNLIKVFPNPVKDELNISVKEVSTDNEIRLVDTYNREIMRWRAKRDTDYSIDLRSQPLGIYLLQVRSDNQLKTVKILRN